MHGPTCMGHAVACTAANTLLDLSAQQDRISQVCAISIKLTSLVESCRDLKRVEDEGVNDAVGVVEIRRADDLNDLKGHFLGAGVWIRSFGNIVYLTLVPAIDGGSKP